MIGKMMRLFSLGEREYPGRSLVVDFADDGHIVLAVRGVGGRIVEIELPGHLYRPTDHTRRDLIAREANSWLRLSKQQLEQREITDHWITKMAADMCKAAYYCRIDPDLVDDGY